MDNDSVDNTASKAHKFEERLEELLNDTEEMVRELRQELRDLRAHYPELSGGELTPDGYRHGSEEAQRAEVERLEELFAQTKVNWRNVRDFVVESYRESRRKKED